ncbi:ribonuclease-3 [Kineosphaera limosa]|uniref:Ribonuclease 3 n=1 Tax=Kineosphaera limosa NBRC 100340 TaxID=1184609 RepID=K6WFD0_9MICO|nr:ribonuclease III [Kineosphaera limosa]NYD99470.1 ribonuclease-3 [Kineosphaera limosa]GAB98005.1 ribonuclease III [Kineosphaera limosa NBRC 100340]
MGSSRAAANSERRDVAGLVEAIHGILGIPIEESLLDHALTHRSYAYENGGIPNNERLEFLGDSVLGLVVTESLYADHPDMAEGQLAKLRAAVVNMRALGSVARRLELGDYLLLGRGEEATGGRDKTSILADTVEALIGTVYLAHGLEQARRFVHHLVDPLLASSARLGAGLDWKTSLQELAASGSFGSPEYRVSEEGPDHEKVFTAHVVISEEVLGDGNGRSKKEAEQKAAEQAWKELTRRANAVLTSEPEPEALDGEADETDEAGA